MGALPGLRRENAAEAAATDGIEGFPALLPQVQAGEPYQRAEFSNRDLTSARSKDAVLTAISVVMHCIFFRRKT